MKTFLTIVLAVVLSSAGSAQKTNQKTETIKVLGACGMCQERIEKTLKRPGIYKATWEAETNLLTVSYDSTKMNRRVIQQKLADVGHDTEEFRASDKVYERLPACCHYPRSKKEEPVPDTTKTDSQKNNLPEHPVTITGTVTGMGISGQPQPLINASLVVPDVSYTGVTDKQGAFQLTIPLPAQVIVSYVGYLTDTVMVTQPGSINIALKQTAVTKWAPVVVAGKNQSTHISSSSTLNTLNIGSKELAKAACCNLSESFETSPSVDVSYSDAVTGMKQIQLLGLSGSYTQLLTENTPEIKGLPGSYGLTFIPGPWIDGIQVTKGTGSVVNGFESIAGQINVEEKKPDKADKLFINAYANNLGRVETSADFATKLNNRWSTALLTHANGVLAKTDKNMDHFSDLPTGSQVNMISRWRYANTKGMVVQFAIKALNDHRQAGELDFNPSTDKLTTRNYGVGIQVQQYTFTGKAGYVFPNKVYKSIGLIVSAGSYNNNAYYGLTKYDARQRSFYANLIYQSVIGSTAHKFRTGISLENDNFRENYNTSVFNRAEAVPGMFFEYTQLVGTRLTFISGLRFDHHNSYGLITTPRLHIKYDITPKTNFRFSAGSGFRTANIFAENAGLFVSARKYYINNPVNDYGYGLGAEKAWNFGINLVRNFKIDDHNGTFSIDAYRTIFKNQVVIDVDADPQKVLFYPLNGKSFSNSLQAELNYEPVKKLELRLAYRWLDVQTNYHGTLLQKPLTAKHRAFINAAFETVNKWKFDFTTQWMGQKRLPNTSSNPVDKQMAGYSPSYIQMSAQVIKQLGLRWEVYIGAENLTGYMQKTLFIDGLQPFGPYFDGSAVWGPVNGRVIYTGMRFRIK